MRVGVIEYTAVYIRILAIFMTANFNNTIIKVE